MTKLKNPGLIKFSAVINGSGTENSGGGYIEFPFDTLELYGTAGRIPVKAKFDGIEYRGTMVKYGTPKHILVVVKDIREKIGKSYRDSVEVTLELEEGERIVEIPADLATELSKHPQVKEKFDKLAYSHRKEYVRWIEDAKKPETRAVRIAKTIEKLRN